LNSDYSDRLLVGTVDPCSVKAARYPPRKSDGCNWLQPRVRSVLNQLGVFELGHHRSTLHYIAKIRV
jgi:hypothetical protein